MATITYWTPYVVTRTTDNNFPTLGDAGIVRNIADELIECVTDVDPPGSDTGVAEQIAWTTDSLQVTGGNEEVCDVCERHANATTATFASGLMVPYYFDMITRKCVAPGTGAAGVTVSENPTYTNHGGPVMTNAVIWLIFWGTTWSSQTTRKNNITSLVQTKLLGTDSVWWSTAKADYGNFNTPLWGGAVSYTGSVPVNTAAYVTPDIQAALIGALNGGLGLPAANSNVFVSKGINVSNIVYVMIPDLSWRAAPTDPTVGLNAAWDAYHWVVALNYTAPTPPPPPPPPPGSPPPVPPTSPPPTTDASNNGFNTVDGLLSTAWTATGSPTIAFDLGFSLLVDRVKIDFMDGEKKVYFFDIQWSIDGSTWNNIDPATGQTSWKSDGTSISFQTFTIPLVVAQWIRLVGHGNNAGSGAVSRNDTFAISEIQIWGPEVDTTVPPSGGGTGTPPPGTPPGGCTCSTVLGGSSLSPPSSGSGISSGTGVDTGSNGPNLPGSTAPIVTVFKDFIDTYNLAVETGDFCAAENLPAPSPLAEVYNTPVSSAGVYLKMALAGGEVQRVGEAVVTDNSQLIGLAPRKVTVILKRVGTCDGVIYARIRDHTNHIMQELGTMPAGSVGLNDSTCDFENDAAQYILKKGDVIWIEYTDPSANDGLTYILYKAADTDHYDAINSMFVKYTSTTVPDSLSDLAAVISV